MALRCCLLRCCLPTSPSLACRFRQRPARHLNQMAQGLSSTAALSSHLTPCPPAQPLPLRCSLRKFPATNRQQLPQRHSPAQGQTRLSLLRLPPSSGRQEAGKFREGGSSCSLLAAPCHHRPFPIFTSLRRSSARGQSAFPAPSASPQLAATQIHIQKQRCWLGAPLLPGRAPLKTTGAAPSGSSPGCTGGMLAVERWDEARRGPLSEGAMREGLQAEGYSLTRYVFPPGTVFDYHDHSVAKKDCVLSGRFLFRMGGRDVVLGPGDMIEVPAGTLHYAAVVGTEPVVFLDASKRS